MSADRVGDDGGDPGLVRLGVGHSEVVHTLDIVDLPELYPHLVRQGLPELVQDWLEDGVVHEVERVLEGTGGETPADQQNQQEGGEPIVFSEPS